MWDSNISRPNLDHAVSFPGYKMAEFQTGLKIFPFPDPNLKDYSLVLFFSVEANDYLRKVARLKERSESTGRMDQERRKFRDLIPEQSAKRVTTAPYYT